MIGKASRNASFVITGMPNHFCCKACRAVVVFVAPSTRWRSPELRACCDWVVARMAAWVAAYGTCTCVLVGFAWGWSCWYFVEAFWCIVVETSESRFSVNNWFLFSKRRRLRVVACCVPFNLSFYTSSIEQFGSLMILDCKMKLYCISYRNVCEVC